MQNSSGHSISWNFADSPKVNMIIGKFGLKQGANIKNIKALKSFRTDLCNYEILLLHSEVL